VSPKSSKGLLNFHHIVDELKLPKNLKPEQLHIHPKEFGSRICTLCLTAVPTVINGKEANVDMSSILVDPKLLSLGYFDYDDTVQVIVPEGYISKYIKTYIVVIDYIKHANKFVATIRRYFRSSSSADNIHTVFTSSTIDWAAFIKDWIDAGYPQYFGIDEDVYIRRALIEAKVAVNKHVSLCRVKEASPECTSN